VYIGRARVLEPGEEEQQARLLLAGKYQGWKPGAPLSGWARTALPVAVDLLVERRKRKKGSAGRRVGGVGRTALPSNRWWRFPACVATVVTERPG